MGIECQWGKLKKSINKDKKKTGVGFCSSISVLLCQWMDKDNDIIRDRR